MFHHIETCEIVIGRYKSERAGTIFSDSLDRIESIQLSRFTTKPMAIHTCTRSEVMISLPIFSFLGSFTFFYLQYEPIRIQSLENKTGHVLHFPFGRCERNHEVAERGCEIAVSLWGIYWHEIFSLLFYGIEIWYESSNKIFELNWKWKF